MYGHAINGSSKKHDTPEQIESSSKSSKLRTFSFRSCNKFRTGWRQFVVCVGPL